jgi:SAM-dependent methyltransferase
MDDRWAVLKRCTVAGDLVKLPNEILPRKLYEEVNAVLEALGGKWSRKLRCHVFDYDVTEALAATIELCKVPDKNPTDYFPTPEPVVLRMLELVGELEADAWVLEPSAGTGNIVRLLPASVNIDAVELLPKLATKLDELGNERLNVHRADFFDWEADRQYDYVLMNPPFTSPEDPLAYIQHIQKAAWHLKPNGRLVSVVPAGAIYRTQKRIRYFRDWIDEYGFLEILPDDSFKDSGTGVNTCLVYYEKPATLPDPEPVAPARRKSKPEPLTVTASDPLPVAPASNPDPEAVPMKQLSLF